MVSLGQNSNWYPRWYPTTPLAGLCIKVGRGHGGGDFGTRVSGICDLGTRDEGLEDIKYGTQGRVGRGRGDVKHRDAEDTGCE